MKTNFSTASKGFLTLIMTLLLSQATFAQMARVVGTLTDEQGQALFNATVGVEGSSIGTLSNEAGLYSLNVPAGQEITLFFSYVGYNVVKKKLKLNDGQNVKIDLKLELQVQDVIEVTDRLSRSELEGIEVKPEDLRRFPMPNGSLEQVLQFVAPGVSAGTGGELTSQYSVRGGNYDENLVYVNGFEIYRPMLVRTGQQEGLTFANPNMTKGFTFSTGGFGASYGDKMSSVLDIRYKRPEKFGGSLEGSLLGGSAHIEGALFKKGEKGKSNGQRLSYMVGARYKTTQLLLGSLNIKGEYIPTFIDIQANMVYDLSKRLQWELIGNYNSASYQLIPQTGSATTGLFNFALRLNSIFDGAEKDDFTTQMGGTSLTWRPKSNTQYKWLASVFSTLENERVDINAQYRLEQVQTNIGAENFGEAVGTLAYGETQQFIRNSLFGRVANTELRGSHELIKERFYDPNTKDDKKELVTRRNTHLLTWGVKYQQETIQDRLREWNRLDSLGYTIPASDTGNLVFPGTVRANINLSSHRVTGFFQDSWTISDPKKEIKINMGVRAGWWTLNNEPYITPRAQILYAPKLDSTKGKLKNITYRLAIGAYYQTPFYRELRNQRGIVNTDVKAQKSVHFLGGASWDFRMLKRPFKFVTEAYYKHLWDIVPYDLDNVRVRYYGDNMATGYATGIDFRLNGELVPDAESWVNLSFLRVREKFDNVQHFVREVGDTAGVAVNDVPRPTDQAMILSMFFQDYLPKNKWLKVNLALTVGTGMPFGLPHTNTAFENDPNRNNTVYRNTYRYNPYHRIDIGFSASLWDKALYEERKASGKKVREKSKWIMSMQRAWVSVEVFNLMEVANTASNTWIRDFQGISYAIPNYLTSRRVNVRFRVEF